MEKLRYQITVTLDRYFTDAGEYAYLIDENGQEVAEVVPVKGYDLFDLVEDNDNKKVS